MSKFKVTLRKNGKAVGEMHYGSEAVAVTKAKAMKDATGCDVTVAPAKANRRRAAKPRRNTTVLWTPQGPASEAHGTTRWTSVEVESRNGGKTYEVVAYGYADGREVRSVRAFGSKTPEVARRYADEVRRELRVRENPRRNGTGLRLASGSALEGSSEIGSAHDAALAARIRGELAGMVAEGMTSAQAVSAWMRKWESMFLYDPPPAVVKASQRAFVQSLVPKRNGHRCNPSCGCPKSNPKRKYRVTWHERDAHGRTEKFSTTVEANNRNDVLWQFRQHGSVEVTPIRAAARRRNGTTAGEAAASRSLAHRAGLMWNRRSS